MPRGRQNAPKGKKGRSKGRSRSGGTERGAVIPAASAGIRNILSIQQNQRLRMAYTFTTQLSGVTGAFAFTPQLANSAYNGGVSVQGYAKWMSFYTKCYCIGASTIAHFTTNTATSTVQCGINVTTNTSSLGNGNRAIDTGLCTWSQIGNNPDSRTLRQRVNVGRFLHKPKVLDNDSLYSAVGADPTQVVVFHYWIQPLNAATVSVTITGEVIMDVILADPQPFT